MAAAAVLAILALVGIRLLPFYLHNQEFQRFLRETASQRENLDRPEDQLRIAIAQKASALGLPVKTSQIELDRSPAHMRIGVKYIVQAAFPLYAVDLHFSPSAESAFR